MTLQLTAADSAGSSLLALSGGTVQPFSYSPFGATASRTGAPVATVPGFNGERADPLTGVTHLGNGYRAYSPALRRFTSPDSESPFGVGGINPYAYCSSDPVNQRDPSGHGPLMWLIEGIIWGAAKLGKNLALSEAAAAAVSTTESVILGVSAAGSISTGIASAATRNSNPEVSAKLGWASLGLGITAAAFGIPKAAGRIRSKLKPAKKYAFARGTINKDEIQRVGGYELNYRVFGYDVYEDGDAIEENFHIKDMNEKHHDLIVTHGNEARQLLVCVSEGVSYYIETAQEFVDYFNESGIDLTARKTPLHLVACFMGSRPGSGNFGDQLATLLDRTVITYGRDEAVFTHNLTARSFFNSARQLVILRDNKIDGSMRAEVNYHYPSAEI